MSESRFYCKIHFNTKEDAARSLEPITVFIKEGIEAEAYWDIHRASPAPCWDTFREKYPLIAEYLADASLFGGNWENGLCSVLNFGNKDEAAPCLGDGAWIEYSAAVWHMAEWDTMMKYAQKKYGAVRCSWMSDEDDIDYFDLLE